MRLLKTTHNTQQTDIYSSGRIRSRSPRHREPADPRVRPRGHWVQWQCKFELSVVVQHNRYCFTVQSGRQVPRI